MARRPAKPVEDHEQDHGIAAAPDEEALAGGRDAVDPGELVSGETMPELEEDPGELVSLWYRMRKKYEDTLESLQAAGDALNQIGSELDERFGVKVPRVALAGRSQDDPAGRGQSSTADPDPESDGPWAPPAQGPIVMDSPSTGPAFVEELRRSASIDGDEKGFAASIANLLGQFKGFA